MNRRFFLLIVSLIVIFTPALAAMAADVGNSSAISQLESFLKDPAARSAYAAGDPQAAQSNQLLEKFPPWAQQEILEIVVDIVREGNPPAAGDYSARGAESAYAGFSPQVKARINALVKRLEADPEFNNRQNLENMKSAVPR